jgi:integrase/recombinase XerD
MRDDDEVPLEAAGHGADEHGAPFRPIRNHRTGYFADAITPDGIYKLVCACSASTKIGVRIGGHALRATAATNALDREADIDKVQEWLVYANISTTRIYNHRRTRVEDSPTSPRIDWVSPRRWWSGACYDPSKRRGRLVPPS